MQSIDLRSDTVTVPSQAMREAMANAVVGDDVFGEDPTVRALEELAAELTGKAAGLFVTSGTQGNIIALLVHCGRGEAAILGQECHINCYEGGGIAALGGIMPYTVPDAGGIPAPEAVLAQCHAPDVHYAPRRLLCLENTHNRGGGLAVPVDTFTATARAATEAGLRLHLDGARLFNACARWDVPATAYADLVDSVQLCLSKGLGAPLGTVICGSHEFIDTARHWRKRLGGGMRQAGIVAAAGIYALTHHRERLRDDHANASRLAELLAAGGVPVETSPWGTNMVFFSPADTALSAEQVAGHCDKQGVRLLDIGPRRLRAVTHLNVSATDIEIAGRSIVEAAGLTCACRSC